MKKPLLLCILDGCGMRESSDGNAFKNANKKTFDYLWNDYPHSLLGASEEYVGLPHNQIGTSEVGHMTIGAGRTIYQPIEILNRAIEDKSIFDNEKILSVFDHVKREGSNLHIIGLVSDGGVHSHINHLFALIDMVKKSDIKNVFFHVITDGRDTPPKSAKKYITMLSDKITEVGVGTIASISGRYYAMDRDNNLDRVKLAYDMLVDGIGPKYASVKDALEKNYNDNITDEFILPGTISDNKICSNDGIITFNFRKDRLRELFTAFTNPEESDMPTKKLDNLQILTMFAVTETVKCPHAFEVTELTNNLGEYLYRNGMTQLRIAETEKYAHVTYYFDGGEEEKEYETMKKILIQSPRVATYDLKPEMSVYELTDSLIHELEKDYFDVIILNYANGDMVGHTGNYDAAIKAIEAMDECLKRVYNEIHKRDGILIVTADHGNCDIMWDENHEPVTSHTLSKVPFIVCKKNISLNDGTLADIAPTILDLLELVKPREMTGKSLIRKIK